MLIASKLVKDGEVQCQLSSSLVRNSHGGQAGQVPFTRWGDCSIFGGYSIMALEAIMP